MDERAPGYYAVIPASVRYDDQISANAKLLYGEISALIGAEGFCYASNAHFADLYKVSERTITGWISALKEGGYIVVDLVRDNSGQVTKRKMYLASSASGGQLLEENFYTPRKNFREGIEKNFQYTNLSITNIDKENIKESSKGKKREGNRAPKTDFDPLPLFVAWVGEVFPREDPRRKNALYYALVRLAENRVAIRKPILSQNAVTALCNKLQRYSQKAADPLGCMIDLLDTAVSSNWQTVYPPKGAAALEGQKPGGRVYECL